MEAPQHIAQALRGIRDGLHLRWNVKAKLVRAGTYDANGKLRNPEYDPRWELWDRDPDGRDYMVMRLEDAEGGFKPVGQWLVDRVQRFNPEHYGGDLARMMRTLEAEADKLREMDEKEFEDMAEAAGKWAEYLQTPKSAASLAFRGQRMRSPGF